LKFLWYYCPVTTLVDVHNPNYICINVAGTTRETKSPRPFFTGSREFFMLADSGEIISQNPEP
jgi:hypothetical protein